MRGTYRRQQNHSGQAAIEFIVVIVVIFFFLLFFLSLSILMVVSDYMEYATFMAARTYKSGFSTKEFQRQYAQTVFNNYIRGVEGLARDITLDFVDGGENGEQAAGVKVDYTTDLFYLPPLFMVGDMPLSQIRLSTEARLGRDPANQDCKDYFTNLARRLNLSLQGSRILSQMEDNGC